MPGPGNRCDGAGEAAWLSINARYPYSYGSTPGHQSLLMATLPDQAVRELPPGEVEKYTVIRVAE